MNILRNGLPVDFQEWIKNNSEYLQPPVGNYQVWKDSDFIVTVIGGPNQRSDFHDDPFEEFFYQFKGDAQLLIEDRGKIERIELKEGSIFLLPPHVLHSPQRPVPESLGLVIERSRPAGAIDAFQWYCAKCVSVIYRDEFQLNSIVNDIPIAFERFYSKDDNERKCQSCGEIHPGREWRKWHKQLNID